MISKILVPIDGSEHANRALDFALDLAQKYSSEVIIMTVIHYGAALTSAEMPSFDLIANAIDEFHQKTLADAGEKVRKVAPKLKVSTKLEKGYPADKIIETVEKEKCDLVVMGRRGQSHLRHTLLGSVSDRVADLCPCGLFIIK